MPVLPAPPRFVPTVCSLCAIALFSLIGDARSAAAAELRVAVLEFDGGGDPELLPIGKALQAMITTDLSAVPSLKLIERARLNEILVEQKLGRSGAVDPKTAAKLGKLAGASHLLAGNCTVAGGKMRIDGRLFAVQTGDVLLAEKIEGEKDAFFELEKALVNKLIGAVGVKLAPKERAEIARVHTADFEAFKKFGQGLQLYDEKKYDLAIAALREAETRDKDFKLAALTLDEYQRIISKLQTRADDILQAQRDLERAKADKSAQAEAGLVEKLYAIAAKAGDKLREERVTALHALAVALGNLGGRKSKLMHLRAVQDRFALERSAEAAAARYVAEAIASFPFVPLTVDEDRYANLDEKPEEFDKSFAWAIKKLTFRGDIEENRKNALVNSTRYVSATAQMLHYDQRQTVAFHQQLFDLSKKLQPGDYHLNEQTEELAKEWRSILELDRSTALFTELSRRSDNPWRLKGLAAEIETNRNLAQLLSSAADPAGMREYIILSKCNGQCSAKELFGTLKRPGGTKELARHREMKKDDYVLIGTEPAWVLQNYWFLQSGPRADQLRADEIRYNGYDGRSYGETASTVIVGAAPRKDFQVSMRIDFKPAKDYWGGRKDSDSGVEPGRPEPAFLFGARDIDCAEVRDDNGKKSFPRPMRASAIVFAEDGVRLVELSEKGRDNYGSALGFEEKVLGSEKIDLKSAFDVSIRASGDSLRVEAGGKSASFKVPADRQGFTGFRFRGAGYVGVSKLKFAGKSDK